MKITIIFLLTCVICTFAEDLYSQNARITLNRQNIMLSEILNEIERQTDYLFIYNDEVNVNLKVSVKAKTEPVYRVLDKLLAKTDVKYVMSGTHIVLSKSGSATEITDVQQQTKRITGTVFDAAGEPVIGATVMEKGKAGNATVTDAEGKFSLTVGDNAVLQVSFIGYTTQEIGVGNRTVLNIILAEDPKLLDEVVVIGYGTVRKRDLTGAVSSVGAAQLKDIPVTSAAQAIVGRMPGVQVTQTEGSPDAEIKIRIRGGGSLTQDNSPLYIVDGFPVDNINDISPSDIQSIDVLKDASSTAIYGARGANGVIIVTTKSGVEGRARVSYNAYFGAKKITGYYDVMDSYDFVLWQWEQNMLSSANNFGNLENTYGNIQDIPLYKSISGTNWQKKILGETGSSLSHNLSVSGGVKAVKYNVSLTRNDEDEIMMEQGYSRTNLVGKTVFQINSRLSLDMNFRLSDYSLRGAGTSSGARLNHIVQFRPVNGLHEFVDTDGDAGDPMETEFSRDPYKQTQDDYRRTKRLAFSYDAAANIKLLKDLVYRFGFSYRYSANTTKRFYGLHTSEATTYSNQPLASSQKTDGIRYTMTNSLTYTKRNFLPEHNLTLLAGEELVYSKDESILAEVRYLPKYIDAVSALAMMQLGQSQPVMTVDNPNVVTSSYFGRAIYDYKGKYLLQATFRADGSSKFAPGNQWGYFPSVSGAWRISDEPFMKTTQNLISNLKLRLSYGVAGNNRIGNDLWKKTFSVGGDNVLYMEGNETTPTTYLVPGGMLSNPLLRWETTITRNGGIDFGFFKDRLSGSLELYHNTTKDLLIQATIPSSSGYTAQMQNIGQTSNRGLEISFNAAIVQTEDFLLSANFNIGFNKNRIDKLGETKRWEQSSNWGGSDGPQGDYLIEEGGQIGLMYGYVTDGMYTFDDFTYDPGTGYVLKEGIANNRSVLNPRVFRPGILKFVNQNPDKPDDPDTEINESYQVDAVDDRVVIGNANPKHTGGFGLNVQYKAIDFSAFFNWVYGNNIYNANKLAYTALMGGRNYRNLLDMANSENRFTYLNPETGLLVTDPDELQAMNQNATFWSPAHSLVAFHSWAVEDGSFLRLNNLTIGYSLPPSWLSKIKVEQFRLYVTGYNLWLWTKYTGYDPEVDTRRTTPLTPGVDYNAYPRSRSFNVGLNLTF